MIEKIFDIRVDKDELAIFWSGQNSFFLKTPEGTLIAIDPYFSRTPGVSYIRSEPPLRPEEIIVDYVFCTHDHLDHTDPETLSAIAKNSPKTTFFGPPESYRHFIKMGIPQSKAKSLKAGITLEQQDFKVTPYSSILGYEVDHKGKPWISHYGHLFDFGFVKLYNLGDTSQEATSSPEKILNEVAKLSPEIAIFPIVGDIPTRKPEDACTFAKIVNALIVIPSHYGCFRNRTIDPEIFIKLCQEAGISAVLIDYGDVYIYKS